jgi:hypothetical protein
MTTLVLKMLTDGDWAAYCRHENGVTHYVARYVEPCPLAEPTKAQP